MTNKYPADFYHIKLVYIRTIISSYIRTLDIFQFLIKKLQYLRQNFFNSNVQFGESYNILKIQTVSMKIVYFRKLKLKSSFGTLNESNRPSLYFHTLLHFLVMFGTPTFIFNIFQMII